MTAVRPPRRRARTSGRQRSTKPVAPARACDEARQNECSSSWLPRSHLDVCSCGPTCWCCRSVDADARRNVRTRRDPRVIALERHSEPVVEDPEIAVPTARHRPRHDGLHFLRNHAHIGTVAAVVAEAVESQPVVEMAEQHDVVLERDIGSPAATAATAAAAATTEPAAAPATESTTAATAESTAAATGEACAAPAAEARPATRRRYVR